MKQLITVVLILVLAMSVVAFAQEKKEMKKDDKVMMKDTKLKEFTCKPECGFMVRSHDESEIMSLAKTHAKQHHNMDMTDEQVKEMMHDTQMAKKDMAKKKMKQEETKKEEMKNSEMKH